MSIDIHIIQNVPFSNLNRDDTNRPKTTVYGGSQRLRVSSQSWKRAAREVMEESGLAPKTYLSRNGSSLLASKLIDAGMEEELASATATWAFDVLGSGNDVVLRMAESEIDALSALITERASAIAAAAPAKQEVASDGKKAKSSKTSKAAAKVSGFASVISKKEIDNIFSGAAHRANAMGLFGRMLASNENVSVDASVQVAHAISTHTIETDFDFFLAMEELPQEGEGQGGAHLGAAEFASGTLYRYATIDEAELLRNCNGDASLATALATAFIESFVLSMPSGKKNATAPATIPSIVHVSVRPDRSVNMIDAFEKAVDSRNGTVGPSVKRLDERAGRTKAFLREPKFSGHVSSIDVEVTNLGAAQDSLRGMAAEAVKVAFQ
jgi:CRISPR system Cascade subunit CasC